MVFEGMPALCTKDHEQSANAVANGPLLVIVIAAALQSVSEALNKEAFAGRDTLVLAANERDTSRSGSIVHVTASTSCYPVIWYPWLGLIAIGSLPHGSLSRQIRIPGACGRRRRQGQLTHNLEGSRFAACRRTSCVSSSPGCLKSPSRPRRRRRMIVSSSPK